MYRVEGFRVPGSLRYRVEGLGFRITPGNLTALILPAPYHQSQ